MNKLRWLLVIGVLACVPSSASAQLPVQIPSAPSWSITERCYDTSKATSVIISTATAGDLELVSATASQIVYVCGWNFISSGTNTIRFIYGTGSNCATGQTGLTGIYAVTAQVGMAIPNTGAIQTKTPASNALCIEIGSSVQVSGMLTYVKE